MLAKVPYCPDSDHVLTFPSLLPLESSDLTMDASTENPSRPRFGDATKEELDALVRSAVPKNTRVATSFWINIFPEFCQERRVSIQFQTCTAEELIDALFRFYKGLRTKAGGFYKKLSYLSARGSIGRYFTVELKRPFNVFQTPALQESNRVLNAVLVENKTRGEDSTVHKEDIEGDDATRLDAYFDDVLEACNAVKLSQYCWYNVTTHFVLRSAEVQVQLKKSDLSFKTDGEGNKYVALKRDFVSKNAKGGLNGREFVCDGRMCEQKKISALRLLLSKLHPDVNRVFQRAIIGELPADKPVWFMKCPLEHNVLTSMMARTLEAAGLKRRYTNHCVRATVVTKLKNAGYKDRAICKMPGLKNLQSLASYQTSDKIASRSVWSPQASNDRRRHRNCFPTRPAQAFPKK